MRYTTIGVGAGVVALLALVVRAEKANMSPDALARKATHIVVGKVNAIYTREHREGQWRYTRYVAEVAIEKVEKGDGLDAGGLVYVRYWHREWNGEDMPATTTGHRGLPEEGERLRVYLARNAYDGFSRDNTDGGFNVIGANGFERLKG